MTNYSLRDGRNSELTDKSGRKARSDRKMINADNKKKSYKILQRETELF